ncbi:Cation channel sperm-associated protein 1 [Quaeritorhiza haematococci]|nr:Cation channel sperm-associated protein 1 [Quaeritorhiza haematococci]
MELDISEEWYFSVIDSIFLGLYVLESTLKLYAWQLSFFKSGWNVFDLLIVIVSILTWILPVLLAASLSVNVNIFRLLRLFRAVRAIRSLRVLRTISFLKSLQIIVGTMLKSIPAMGNIIALSGLILYIFAVIATSNFRLSDPRRFGNLGASFFNLYALLTLDNWSDIYNDNKDTTPSIWAFLFVFIILQPFIFLNLFVAVIVNNLQTSRAKLKEARAKRRVKRKKAPVDPTTAFLNNNDDMDKDARAGLRVLKDHQENAGLTGVLEEDSGVDNYYPPNLPGRLDKELLAKFFMLMTSLERNMDLYEKQQKVLDDLGEYWLSGIDSLGW